MASKRRTKKPRASTLRNFKRYNWKAITVAFLVTVLALGAWQYLESRTNQGQLIRDLESKQAQLDSKLEELNKQKDTSKQLEDTKKQLELEKAELQKQLSAKKHTATAYAAALPAANRSQCVEWVLAAKIDDVASAMKLIQAESGCDPRAGNPSSGACNVAQEWPCGKSGCAYGDGACSVRWMDAYVKRTYGTWANAYATHQSRCGSDKGCWY